MFDASRCRPDLERPRLFAQGVSASTLAWAEAVEQAFYTPFSDRTPLPGLFFSERSPLPGLVFKPSQHRSVKELATLVYSQRSACPAFDVVCVHTALAEVVDYDDLLDAPRFPVEIECTAFVQLAAWVCLEVVPPSVSH
eukprot:scaffold67620_cov41-Phaeocystis_antarctica.AAC.2